MEDFPIGRASGCDCLMCRPLLLIMHGDFGAAENVCVTMSNRMPGLTLRQLLSVTLVALTASTLSAQPLAPGPHAVAPPAAMMSASWQGPGIAVEVTLGDGERVAAEGMPALPIYAVGVLALPMMIATPPAVVAWPFVMLLAPPFQASFNADAETLSRGLAAASMPARVVDAFRAQWPATTADDPPWNVKLTLAAYGLTTSSGKRLEAFEPKEDLCLSVDASLEWGRAGSPVRREPLSIGHRGRSADAPPPLCKPMRRFAADDARLLRQAIDELAEVLAAMVLNRLEGSR